MPRLHLVRHGHAAAGWDEERDPGLDLLGARQADAVGLALQQELSPRPIVSSPLRRAVETAGPLAARWNRPAAIDGAFGEIPSPTEDLALRQRWLRSALAGRWDQLDEAVEAWRRTLLAAVRTVEHDLVVFTHFVAINAVVSEATGDPAVTTFLPANASVTVVDVAPGDGAISLVQRGSEAATEVG
ncbi:histidine phosphatase family protein [Aquihabitans sp. McL0605]|uniref:histidine phosphatase family protein n=1 Tax=Aquihabitans sp. McL0605 TaxID=3415671 RepID=UPI003CF11C47